MEQARAQSSTAPTTTARSTSTTSGATASPPPTQSQVQESKKNKLSSTTGPVIRKHRFVNTQSKGAEMEMGSDNGNKTTDIALVPEEDTEMVGNNDNGMDLSRSSMLIKEYTERDLAAGTITPHNSQFSNSDNENENENTTNLFKQFDPKTGQFLRSTNNRNNKISDLRLQKTDRSKMNNQGYLQQRDKCADSSLITTQEDVTTATTTTTTTTTAGSTVPENTSRNAATLQSVSSLGIYVKGKFRSHSVPTISHSSLRKLTNYSKQPYYHYHNTTPNQKRTHHKHHLRHHPNHINPLSGTTMNSAGIKKKKVIKTIQSFNKGVGLIQNSNHPKSVNSMMSKTSSTGESVRDVGSNNNLEKSIELSKDKISGPYSKSSSHHNTILLCHHGRPTNIKYEDLNMEERIGRIENHSSPMPLPPINLQCLKEIDLQEIVKNPQLRHDIIFDPLLQFRPNLDGERGIKKKQLADKYWNDVENEIFVYSRRSDIFNYNHTRLVPLFNTLREVLLTIVPQREAHVINDVLDTELSVQELLKGSLVMSNLSEWLAQLFKHHCAPMRDAWVDKMSLKFKEAEEESSLSKLIEALRLVFQILEAMKLDIANHQIRILRTALLSNSVEFEKQYFQSLMYSNRVNLKSSLVWFNKKYEESKKMGKIITNEVTARDIYKLCIRSIISLLSCRKMVREYPTSLSFDHARLILLRADIRQIVCLLVCRLLFKQLVANDATLDKSTKDFINTSFTIKRLKEEVVSIITDEHGNCRWTKNIMSIAIHLCKTIQDLKNEYLEGKNKSIGDVSDILSSATSLDTAKVDFAKSWLSKQTQPLSEVYGVLENRVFKSLEENIFNKSGCTLDGRVKQDFIYLCSCNTPNNSGITSGSTTSGASLNSHNASVMNPPREGSTRGLNNLTPQSVNPNTFARNDSQNSLQTPSIASSSSTICGSDNTFQGLEMEVFENVYRHLYTVVNFHWSVFGCHYMESLNDKLNNASHKPRCEQ